jgi:hypothetical protein
MATNTYDALYTNTVTVATPTVTFNTIDQTYTDLVLVITGRCSNTATGASIQIRANSDSGSNYSQLSINASSSTLLSEQYANTTSFDAGRINTSNGGNTNFGTSIINFQNYRNSTTYKTLIAQSSVTNEAWPVYETVSTWRNTNAITSLTITCGYDFVVGTSFSIYGVRAEGVSPAVKATGGTIYSDSLYYYHVFGSTGVFTPTQSITADALVIAGGGGGGSNLAAGGGAGGLLGFASQSLTATGYTVTVGAGGAGAGSTTGDAGVTGSDSQFGSLTLVKGGGYGGGYSNKTGGNGGSGGGGNYEVANGGTATSGQGNAGGAAINGQFSSGGGGGAGAVGTAGTGNLGVAGGVGSSAYSSWGFVTGTGQNVVGTIYYAGGGGGTGNASITATNLGFGGLGGGGLGAPANGNVGVSGSNGSVNTGGGGGGGGTGSGAGGAGGSGLVIVRYLKA